MKAGNIIMLLLAWTVLVCSCETKRKDETVIHETLDDEFSASDSNNFVILNYTADVLALSQVHANDPDIGTFSSIIYDSLCYVDADGNLRPGLAVSWKQIDEKIYQFKLRQGVRFHNGQPFDAYDVKHTFDTHLDPAVQSATALIWNTRHLVHIKEVAVVDRYTVNFVLYEVSGIVYNMMHMFSAVIPKDYPVEKLKEHPVGTGPYKFLKWDKGQRIVLTKNADYWNPSLPKIENLVFRIMPVDRWLETIIGGGADFIMHLPGKYSKKIEADVNTDLMERPVLSSIWISLKNKGPLRDVRVRRALNYAVNMERIIRYAEYGKGVELASIGRPGEFGFNENLKPYGYDPEKARKLLNGAGYGEGFTLKVFATDITETVIRMVNEDLADINVNLDIDIVTQLEYNQRAPYMARILGTEPTTMYDVTVFIVDNPVIDMLFNCDTLLLSSLSHINHTPYNYPEYENMHNWANVSDPREHERRLKRLDEFIHNNAYFIFTYQRILTSAVRKNVHIKKLNLSGHLEFSMLTETTKD
ncbi:MAG: ABC transporter substrate-binding protein [Spirochaetales bacterium]|nr:ABC transporter substrate-binding protein [Spirochaetales bacterium]